MTQGKIVEYIDHGKFICSVCLQDKGKSLHLLTPSNREVSLSPKRAVLISDGTLNTSISREALLTRLRQIEEARISLTAGIDIRELWELVMDESECFDTKDLAHLVFGRGISGASRV